MGALTASDVLAMLDRHYFPEGRPPAGILAKEIGSPDGKRRADAIWLPITSTRGTTGMVGHEVKVSRSDVLAELADPTKADPWMRYCHRWWLTVSDPALVDGLDIPPLWGVMAPPSGRRTRSMIIVKPAPQLHPHEPAVGVQRVAAWYYERSRAEIKDARKLMEDHRDDAAAWQRRYRELHAQGIRASDPQAARVAGLLKALDEARYPTDGNGVRVRADRLWLDIKDADVALTVFNYARVKRAVEGAKRIVETVLRDVARVKSDDWTFREARDALAAMQASTAAAEASLKPEQLAIPVPAARTGEAG